MIADIRDIAASVASLPEPAAGQLDELLSSVLDKHAPTIRRKVPTRKPSPWYTSVSEEQCAAKRQRLRGERKWFHEDRPHRRHKHIYPTLHTAT